MNKGSNIRKINGRRNCHIRNARTTTARLVGNSKWQDNRTYLHDKGTEQETEVPRRLGFRRISKKRRLQKALGGKVGIRKRMLRRLYRLRVVQNDKSTPTVGKGLRARRRMRIRRKNSLKD